jgi:hypothetical protein
MRICSISFPTPDDCSGDVEPRLLAEDDEHDQHVSDAPVVDANGADPEPGCEPKRRGASRIPAPYGRYGVAGRLPNGRLGNVAALAQPTTGTGYRAEGAAG